MLTQFLFRLSARSGSVLRQLGDCARARVARPGSPSGARVVRTVVVWLDAKSGDGRCPDCAFLCSVLAAMVRTPAGDGWSLSARVVAGTVCSDRCNTDGKLKPVRESHCVAGLHRRAHGAVEGCAADARGCRFRRRRERKVHVRTSELQNYGGVLVATEVHGIVAMHACTDAGVMDVCEAAQVPRAMRWDAFRFSRLLVIRPESTPSRR